jgi:hypothetical protein
MTDEDGTPRPDDRQDNPEPPPDAAAPPPPGGGSAPVPMRGRAVVETAVSRAGPLCLAPAGRSAPVEDAASRAH